MTAKKKKKKMTKQNDISNIRFFTYRKEKKKVNRMKYPGILYCKKKKKKKRK